MVTFHDLGTPEGYGCVSFVCVLKEHLCFAPRDFGKTHRTWYAFCLQDGFSVLPPRDFGKTQKAFKRFATIVYQLEFCRPRIWAKRKRRSNVLPSSCITTRSLPPRDFGKKPRISKRFAHLCRIHPCVAQSHDCSFCPGIHPGFLAKRKPP